MREHLRKHHGWARERCVAEVKKPRRGICPDCEKSQSNVAKHGRLFCPVLREAKAKPTKKTLGKRKRAKCK